MLVESKAVNSGFERPKQTMVGQMACNKLITKTVPAIPERCQSKYIQKKPYSRGDRGEGYIKAYLGHVCVSS